VPLKNLNSFSAIRLYLFSREPGNNPLLNVFILSSSVFIERIIGYEGIKSAGVAQENINRVLYGFARNDT
jgi:hypothetical protein